jgi:thioredoxin reductase (NADPH)
MKFLWETAVVDILEGEAHKVGGLLLKDLKKDHTFHLPADGIFIAIGHEPNTALFQGKLSLDERGYIKTLPGTTQTNIAGVFAAGDVQDPIYRQAVTAAGTGCMAAIDAERYLEGGHGPLR